MTLETPIETLHYCLSSAQYKDMLDVTDKKRKPNTKPYVTDKKRKPNTKPFSGNRSNYDEYQAWIKESYEEYQRRPYAHELHVEAMFPQTWSSTALGFGGVGGQAFTSAYVTIIGCDYNYCYCVYFGGRFAYRLDLTKCDIELIRKDVADKCMADVNQKSRYLKK